ncbi:DUF2752 domain-containing protein [Larkinella insperata]|uniref:DUF2752 domain-containing protein n=1 Tax=Larkinella insperata TaxID=332158 RepID=A0ABW3Q008_9BACT|nr:DUF2752 domain-containing protein [Larkinella insperata]
MVCSYGWFNPAQVSFFPPCPFKLLTGLECPGCGSQRCLHQLLHGRVGQAFSYNPLLVLSLPYLLLGFLLEYTPLGPKRPGLHQRLYGKTASWLIFGIVVLYGIGRNVL